METANKPIADRSLLRLEAVMSRVGLRKTAIWSLERDGLFPRGRFIKGTKVKVWDSFEIADYIADQLAQ